MTCAPPARNLTLAYRVVNGSTPKPLPCVACAFIHLAHRYKGGTKGRIYANPIANPSSR